METQNLQPIINFIWSVADDVLVNDYKKGKYGDVILPMTVLRRLDLALEPTKDKVLATYNQYNGKLGDLSGLLTSKEQGSGMAFFNTSPYTMKKLLDDPSNIDDNFLTYLNGFSQNVLDIIDNFRFRNELDNFQKTGLTYRVIEKFCSPKVELSPDKMPAMAMGYVFEDLIRRFNEENNEEAGEHFTPREIIELMTHLLYLPVKEKIMQGTFLVYDPCVGSGAMLTQSKLFATKSIDEGGKIGSKATFHLYGQESTPEIYAVCKSDMLLKNEDPDKIKFGSTLSKYGFEPDLRFNFMLTNPPYGKTWKKDQEELNVGTAKKISIVDRRFNLPLTFFDGTDFVKNDTCLTSRSNDGQLMFMLHMLAKMKPVADGGSRIASIQNGSALFTGDAGSGESGIRQYIIENDMLECIIQLPNDMFYNTGIATYIWIVSNTKAINFPERKGKVQLINATSDKFYAKMRKSLGKKRVELLNEHIELIENLYFDFEENEYSKIFNNKDFGYFKLPVYQPLKDESGKIVKDKKGKPKADTALNDTENIPMKPNMTGDDVLELIEDYFQKEVVPFAPDLPAQKPSSGEFCAYVLKCADGSFYKGQTNDFHRRLKQHKNGEVSWTAKNLPVEPIHWEVFKTRLEAVEREKWFKSGRGREWLKKQYDNKKLKAFERQAGAWYDSKKIKIGYEISFNKYFYKYKPLRPLAEIEGDIKALEDETEDLVETIIN